MSAAAPGTPWWVLAAAFPASEFVGYDIAEDALGRGRPEATEAGLSNVTFELADVAALRVTEPLNVVFAIDAIHDQAAPAAVCCAAWGEQTARRMLGEAGFGEVVTHPAPGLARNLIYVTHRPGPGHLTGSHSD
jgi:methyltransferase family protein